MANIVIAVKQRMTSILYQKFLAIVTTVIKYEIIPPIIGARKIKNTTVKISFPAITPNPSQSDPLAMATCVTAAPANPPIKVCEEDYGIPSHQVRRFHAVAANKPARITHKSMAVLSTVLATVFPTLMSNTQNANTLKNAAQITA